MGRAGNHAGRLCHRSSTIWLIFDVPRRMSSAASTNGPSLSHISGAWARSAENDYDRYSASLSALHCSATRGRVND